MSLPKQISRRSTCISKNVYTNVLKFEAIQSCKKTQFLPMLKSKTDKNERNNMVMIASV